MSEIGTARITNERMRQIQQEGYTPEHDAGHARGVIAHAAACYALLAARQQSNPGHIRDEFARAAFPRQLNNGLWWPWESEAWKPSDDPVRNLEKAGALIAAEIDRILTSREQS